MKTKVLVCNIALFLALALSACNSGITTGNSSATPQNYLYVCGGNTGRSIAAEAIAKGNGLNAFSRASGLDPTDPLNVENGVINALANLALSESKVTDYYTKFILGHQAQQMSYADIQKSTQLYAMTEGHMCRVVLKIKTQAQTSDVEKVQQFTKVHLLSKCAIGEYIAIPDGFGTPESQESIVYGGIIQQINGYILTINHNNGNCVMPTHESDVYDPATTTLTLDEATIACCKLYTSDLNKRFNNYCDGM